MKTILIILTTLLSTLVFAEKVTVATCVMGSGCKFHLSDLSQSEGELIIGDGDVKIPKGSLLVTAKINGKTRNYVESKMNRSQLDKYYGGDGFTQIGLFMPGFQPKSGIWAAEFGTVEETGCEYINQFQQENPFVTTLQGMQAQRDFRFTSPFDPSVLMPSDLIKWKNGINTYIGTLGSDYMQMVYVVKLKSDILIEGYYRVTTIVAVEGGKCEYYIPVTMKCIKADPEEEEWEDWEQKEIIDLFESDKKEKTEWDIPLLDDDEPMPDVPLLDIDKVLPNVPYLED